MWYLFNSDKFCFGTISGEPNHEDLAERGEFAVFSEIILPIEEVGLDENNNVIQITPPPLPIEELREIKWQEIRAHRDRLEQSGMPYLNSRLDTDPISVQRIAMAAQAARLAIEGGHSPDAFFLEWTMQDNSNIDMTAMQVMMMPAILAQYANILHEVARELRERINEAQTQEELDAIVWPDEETYL